MKRSEIPRDSGAVVGCYTVHLYCCHPEHTGWDKRWSEYDNTNEFTGVSEAECLLAAHKHLWWISGRNGLFRRAVLCPYHAREVRR